MLEPYIINCGGFKNIPPVCGFAVWGQIIGDILNQTDLIEYLEDNYQPLNDWLTDISELQATGQPGDIFFVDNLEEIDRLPIGTATYVLQVVNGLPAWRSVATILNSGSIGDLSDVDLDILQTGDLLRWDGVNWVNITLAELLEDINFGDLNDVNFTSLTSGDLAQWNGSAWVNISMSDLADDLSGLLSLDDLSNVSSSDAATTGYILRKTAGDWQAASPATFASSISLDDLSDVTITSPATGAVMQWNGSAWIDAVLGSDDIENDSTVDGGAGTVSDALDSLEGRIDTLESAPGGGGGLVEDLVTLRGSVTAAGGVQYGSGFSVSKPATGTYVVTFTTPLPTSDVTVVYSVGTDSGAGPLDIGSFTTSGGKSVPSTTGFALVIYRWGGATWDPTDSGFTFVAQSSQ